MMTIASQRRTPQATTTVAPGMGTATLVDAADHEDNS